MTTTIEVNVMGWNPKWKSASKPYLTGDFVFQQVAPTGQQLMTTDGSINLNALDISGQVKLVFKWKSPQVAYDGVLYPAYFAADAPSNFWVLPDNGQKPKKGDLPTNGQFTVTRPDPYTLEVLDENSDKQAYIYCLAVLMEIDFTANSEPEWFVADPKITNRGNNRIIRMAQSQSAG